MLDNALTRYYFENTHWLTKSSFWPHFPQICCWVAHGLQTVKYEFLTALFPHFTLKKTRKLLMSVWKLVLQLPINKHINIALSLHNCTYFKTRRCRFDQSCLSSQSGV